MATPAETDYLIVGAGPAGLSLACFMAQHGMTATMISSAPGTADTPRAHLMNPFAIECLRDIGLEDDALRMGVSGPPMESMRWCHSITGVEYGKVHVWGGAPLDKLKVANATPCKHVDLPQSYLEPVMLRYASTNGITCRYNTELIDFKRDANGILSAVKDTSAKTTFQIRSRFIFGADGGKSVVARRGDFSFKVEPSGGVACNILFNADLDHLIQNRESQLHWIMKPDARSRFGIAPTMRMVRPWNKWLLVAFTPGTSEDPFRDLSPKSPELIKYLKELIGDDSVEVDVERLDPWVIRETVAENYCKHGDTYLLGDAAHRHPPSYGLGSNTCIQDGYNLAWKVAYVSKGLAGAGLLDTYNVERQPVGARLVRESNECMDRHAAVWAALGMFAPNPEEGGRQVAELSQATEAGARRRKQLYEALEGKRREGESVGLQMNQWYNSSAVYLEDEEPRPSFQGDDILEVLISTYPGNRFPHAWLTKMVPSRPISTIDLAGHGAFSLFTGHGGHAWKQAAAEVSASTGIPINSYGIGWGLDYNDKYREWTDRREIDENGCILVRPDRYIAWRSKTMIPNCTEKLLRVFNRVLSRDTLSTPLDLQSCSPLIAK